MNLCNSCSQVIFYLFCSRISLQYYFILICLFNVIETCEEFIIFNSVPFMNITEKSLLVMQFWM